MDKNSQELNNNKTLSFSLYIIIILLIILGIYLYYRQHHSIQAISNNIVILNNQKNKLNSELISANKPLKISTTSWKNYCDPYHSIFCFKYPNNWNLKTNNVQSFKYATVSLTNANKTLQLTYQNPYLNDQFPSNFIVYNSTKLNIDHHSLYIIGGYYVEAVEHTPIYAIISSNDLSSSPKKGQNIILPNTLTYSTNLSSVELTVSPINQNFNTTLESINWFQSINGQIALKILQTIYSH